MYPIYRSRCMSTCANIGMVLGSSPSILCGTIGHIRRPEQWNVGFYRTLARPKASFSALDGVFFRRWGCRPPLTSLILGWIDIYRNSSCGRVADKVLMKQMGADDLLCRQLEKQLCLNLSATHVFVNFMFNLITFYYYKLTTHYIDATVHSGARTIY